MAIKGNLIPNRIVTIDGVELTPEASQKVRNHSPDGFNWGYGGSGPAQLALALLLHFSDEDTAQKLYQDFKWDVICNLSPNFEMGSDFVTNWIKIKNGGTT